MFSTNCYQHHKMGIFDFLKSKRSVPIAPPSPETEAPPQPEVLFWDKVYEKRSEYFRQHIGQFPNDILKIAQLFGVWPGGGLFVIHATSIGADIWAHCTFGLSNADMPTSATFENIQIERDELGGRSKRTER